MSESTELKPLIIPKGTRIKIQGCPFYLSDDTFVGEGDEESHSILQSVLADEQKHMASVRDKKNQVMHKCSKHIYGELEDWDGNDSVKSTN